MNRRGFLRGMLGAAAALALRKLPAGKVRRALEPIAVSVGRGSPDIIDNLGLSIDLDERPPVGRVWYVGPHGDDANDGLTPDTCVRTLNAALKEAESQD